MSHAVRHVKIRKEAFKFSSAHMTVFPDGKKEALHGHNYSVEVMLELKSFAMKEMIPFIAVKSVLREICESWDEKVLVQEKCPFFEKKSSTKGELEFQVCGKRYVLPKDEVVLLPIENVTSEALSEEFCRLFISKLEKNKLTSKLISARVQIEETPGQGASFTWHSSQSVMPRNRRQTAASGRGFYSS